MEGDEQRRMRLMFALVRDTGITDRAERLALLGAILHQPVDSSNDLTATEIRGIVDTLNYWKVSGELRTRAHSILAQGARHEKGKIVMRDQRGHQLIQVQFEPAGSLFTYAWAGDGDLAVGDKVQTPPTWWLPATDPEFPEASIGTVCALGSDYPGTITVLTTKVEENENEN